MLAHAECALAGIRPSRSTTPVVALYEGEAAMGELQNYEASSPNLADRFSVISRTISDTFGAPWVAQPIGSQRIARFSWACANGVDYSLADMPALRLVNRSSGQVRGPKFHVFSVDQSMLVKIPGRPTVHVQPEEIVILASDVPCELVMPRDYRTTAFIVEGELFRTYVNDVWAYVGRPLRLTCGLEDILHRTLGAAGDLSRAGLFDATGPTLARQFLELLAMLPLPGNEAPPRRSRNTLEIRRAQAKAFIDRNFARPDITVALIAEHMKVSQRYLQMAFEGDEMTPLEYLRERRLTACAKLLRDPRERHRSITEISFTSGFNSSAHFSTQFRLKFGVSPRRFRGEAADSPAEVS
jgi:AraC-like DNA-binding protein